MKVAACVSLIGVQLFASIVLKLATTNEGYDFSPQSSLVLSEFIKMVLSALYVLRESRSFSESMKQQSEVRLVLHLGGLAALYCFNNGLMFWLFARADPGSITLVKSGATVVSAVLLYFVRGLRLSACRWMVIVVQMLALVVAQYDGCAGQAHLSSRVYCVLVLSLLNSSVANVWNEQVVKQFEGSSLGVKNVYLYLFGAALNVVAFVCTRLSDHKTPRFWQGYSLMAMCVVCSNAFMGIAINCVYKYADALIKNIATSTTTVILVVLSAVLFRGRSNVMVFLGAGIVVVGTYLYFSLGVTEQRLQRLQQGFHRLKSGGGESSEDS